jgi:23S rRNA pseudouridine1911/1915/1917 synthase
MSFKILYEDKNYILAQKPQGMPSQADKTGDEDLLSLCEKEKSIKGLSIINRLDRPVGGIVLFAKNRAAAVAVSKLVQNGGIEKEYTAVLCGKPPKDEAVLEDMLIKNGKTNTSAVAAANDKNAKKAVLSYKVLKSVSDEEFGTLSLVKIHLETGRHHQIRVQFASRGLPLWGDSKYNSAFTKRRGHFSIALWSSRLSFKDPIGRKIIECKSIPEGEIFKM